MDKVKTSCEKCIFAVRTGGVQTGCEFDRLEKFKERNIAELIDESYYEIGAFCNTCRDGEWGSRNPNPKETVLDAIKLWWDAIIVIPEDNFENVCKSIDGLMCQKTLPTIISVVSLVPLNHSLLLAEILQYVEDKNYDVKIFVVDAVLSGETNVVWTDADADRRTHLISEEVDTGIGEEELAELKELQERLFAYNHQLNVLAEAEKTCVNTAFKQLNAIRYYTCLAGEAIDSNMIERADQKLNWDMQRFVSISNGLSLYNSLIDTRVHEVLGGHRKKTVLEMIHDLAVEQESLDMMLSWEDLNGE